MFSGLSSHVSLGVLCEIPNFWKRFEIWVNELNKLLQCLPILKYWQFTLTVFSPINTPKFYLILGPWSTTLKRKRLYFPSLEGVLILGVCYLKDGSYFRVGAD